MADNNIVWLSEADQEMAQAIAAAQDVSYEFARHAELERWRLVPAFDAIAAKAFFPHPNRPGGEHMFVSNIATNGEMISGNLNNDPNDLPGLAEGQTVSFP